MAFNDPWELDVTDIFGSPAGIIPSRTPTEAVYDATMAQYQNSLNPVYSAPWDDLFREGTYVIGTPSPSVIPVGDPQLEPVFKIDWPAIDVPDIAGRFAGTAAGTAAGIMFGPLLTLGALYFGLKEVKKRA